MNRLAKWTMRLYPARWRRRYGDELDALLAETGADTRVVADLLKGGIRMQFSTWSFAKLAVVLGIAGVLLGGVASFLIAPIYESRAVLELTSKSAAPASTELNSLIRRTEPVVLSRTSLANIINLKAPPQAVLYPHEIKVEPLEDVIEEMKNHIHVDLVDLPGEQGNRAAFQISFQYPDPAKAREVDATLVQNFVTQSFQQGLHEAAGKHSLTVIDEPSWAIRPVFPDERVVLLVGCLLGASIPFAWRRLRRKSIATWGFPVLVVVYGFVGLLAANVAFVLGAQGEQNPLGLRYRSTATMFMQNGSPEQMQAIATDVTGRTSIKRNLAITPSGQYFNISFEYPDRMKTQQTVRAVMNGLSETYERTYGKLPDEPVQPAPTVLKVIDVASVPVLPISPNRYVIAVKGGLTGLLAAVVIATIRRRWNPEPELPVNVVNG